MKSKLVSGALGSLTGLVLITVACTQNKPEIRDIPPINMNMRFCATDHAGGLSSDSTTFTVIYSGDCGPAPSREICTYDMKGEKKGIAYASPVGEKLLCTFEVFDKLTRKWKADTTYRKSGLDFLH